MKVVISDLDGTLLHSQTYSYAPALPAIQALRDRNIPLVLCSSKTRPEIELWRERLKIDAPFIVENGGAIYIPRNYFPFPVKHSVERDGYDVIEFGSPYAQLVETLRSSSVESGCQARGFHQMSVPEICLRTMLPVREAEMAKRREYDEPFEISGPGSHNLLAAIEKRGMRWTRGDRLYHITGGHDKALAVRRLIFLYATVSGGVTSIGVGNGHNDADFLKCVDAPIIVRSRFAVALAKQVPNALITNSPGPFGWKEGVQKMIHAGSAAA
jgi:mannosyl-3-phosphoglycerate phosphatase